MAQTATPVCPVASATGAIQRGGRPVTSATTMPASSAARSAAQVRREMVPSVRTSVPSRSVRQPAAPARRSAVTGRPAPPAPGPPGRPATAAARPARAPSRPAAGAPPAGRRSSGSTAHSVPLRVAATCGLPLGVPVADVQPPRLVGRAVRGRGQLPVAPLGREPGLAVVLARRAGAEVAGGDVDDLERQLQRGEELPLPAEQPPVLGGRVLRPAEGEHLHLVEPVHPEDAAGVLPVRPGLAAEAGREPRVPQRSGGQVEDLVRVVRRQRDLRGPDQVEVVGLHPVDLGACAPRKPVPSIASGLTSAGTIIGVSPCAVACAIAEVDERELQLRADPGEEVEPGAGDLGAALGVDGPVQLAELDVVADRLRVVADRRRPAPARPSRPRRRPGRRPRRRWDRPVRGPDRLVRGGLLGLGRPHLVGQSLGPAQQLLALLAGRPAGPAWRSSSARPAAGRRRRPRTVAARPRRAARPPARDPRRGRAARRGPGRGPPAAASGRSRPTQGTGSARSQRAALATALRSVQVALRSQDRALQWSERVKPRV